MDKNSDLKNIIIKTLDINKAYDIVSIDLKDKSSMADYMIIASGTSSRHIQSLSEQVLEKLKDNGIRTTVYWMPIHEYSAYRKFTKKSNVVNTAKTYDEILALPLFPNISKKHQDAVIRVIKSTS